MLTLLKWWIWSSDVRCLNWKDKWVYSSGWSFDTWFIVLKKLMLCLSTKIAILTLLPPTLYFYSIHALELEFWIKKINFYVVEETSVANNRKAKGGWFEGFDDSTPYQYQEWIQLLLFLYVNFNFGLEHEGRICHSTCGAKRKLVWAVLSNTWGNFFVSFCLRPETIYYWFSWAHVVLDAAGAVAGKDGASWGTANLSWERSLALTRSGVITSGWRDECQGPGGSSFYCPPQEVFFLFLVVPF